MKIYLDTGNIEEIKEAASTGLIDGITTNPTLIAKEGRDFKEVLKEIIQIMNATKKDYTLSAEVTKTDSHKDMIEEGRKLAKINKHVLVKIPLTREGLKATQTLSKENIKCNLTLCFSANQALLAAKSGAWCVSPFLGRLDDCSENGLHLVYEIKEIFKNYNFETKILSASIRNTNHITNCAKIGSDIVTIPYKIFQQMFDHELTEFGLEKFKKDWEEYEKKH